LFVNQGAYSISVLNAAGGVVATLAAGDTKSIFISTNSTPAGIWTVVAVGTATSVADAGTLAGPGLKAVGATLGVKSTVVEVSGSRPITSDDRGKTIVLTSGSGTFDLPDVTTMGTDFYCFVKNAGIGSVTIDPYSSQTIDGATTLVLAPGDSCVIMSGATAWYSVGYGRHSEFAFTQLVKDVTAGGSYTLTSAEAANKLINLTASSGFPTVATTIVLPAVASVYYVYVAYDGAASATFKTAAAAGLALTAGSRSILYCDGTNVVLAQSVSVGTSLLVTDGSVGSPSIAFSSEAGTGIYRPTSSAWAVSVAGTERLRANATGVSVTGTLGVTGAATVGGTLGVTGASTLASLGVTANATVGGTLGVTGASTLASLGVTANATVGGTLGVTGVSTLASLGVTANATVGGTLGVTGVSTLASLGVTANATVGGTLGVTGVSTLASLGVTGATTVGGMLTAEGGCSVTSTDAGASAGPIAELYRNSASPAASDLIGQLNSTGNSSTGVKRTFTSQYSKIVTATNAAEDGKLYFQTISAGTLADKMSLDKSGNLVLTGDITIFGAIT
jgi:hypothetical protein